MGQVRFLRLDDFESTSVLATAVDQQRFRSLVGNGLSMVCVEDSVITGVVFVRRGNESPLFMDEIAGTDSAKRELLAMASQQLMMIGISIMTAIVSDTDLSKISLLEEFGWKKCSLTESGDEDNLVRSWFMYLSNDLPPRAEDWAYP